MKYRKKRSISFSEKIVKNRPVGAEIFVLREFIKKEIKREMRGKA